MKRGIIEAGSKDRPLEVHHKIPLTADNVRDPEISLNWDNLELLCKTCHDMERERKGCKRWRVGPDGRVLLEAQGGVSRIRKLVLQLKSQPHIHIEHTQIEEISLLPHDRGFKVISGM